MAAVFGETNIFVKICRDTLQWDPVGQKFCQNRSIAHGFPDTGIFVFSLFDKFVMIY